MVAANRSPLLVARTSHGDFATSDIAAVADWVDEFRVLEDGDVVDLTGDNRWRNRGVDAAPTATDSVHLAWPRADLNGYADYMAKEIDEQPEAAARVLDELGGGIANGTLWTDLGLAPFDRLQVIGCGTSLNAGHVIGNVVRRLGGLPVTLQRGQRSRRGDRGATYAVPGDQPVRRDRGRAACGRIPSGGRVALAGPHQQLALHVGPPRGRGSDVCGRPGDRGGSHQDLRVPDRCRCRR